MKTISFWHRVLDLVAPRGCAICGRRLGISEEVMCATCNLHLPRTFFSGNAYENDMAKLFWGKMPIERAAALFFYQAGSEPSHMIHKMKYHQRPDIGKELGKMLAEEVSADGFFDGIDLIIPVPLARKRLRERGYNQSEWIAQGVAEVSGLPIDKKSLRRVDYKGSQTHQSVQGRIENVAHAFTVADGTALEGKHLLLIDDIVTSGATITSCYDAMRHLEGIKVSVLSLGMAKR